MLICENHHWCNEAPNCGGAQPHEKCPECNNAPCGGKCIEVSDERITWEEFIKWERKPKNKHLRYGQEFMNSFDFSTPDPTLYYQESKHVARSLIMARYVKRFENE